MYNFSPPIKWCCLVLTDHFFIFNTDLYEYLTVIKVFSSFVLKS